jgi:hypothetical protein
MTPSIVNSIGLAFDIAGAILVWRYGLPEPISREGQITIIAEQTDPLEKRKAERYDCAARFGIGLLIFGFALQLLSNFLRP